MLLVLRNQPDDVRFIQATQVFEALANAIQGSRARFDELHLGEVRQIAVVEVRHELIGEEAPIVGYDRSRSKACAIVGASVIL